MAEIQIGPLTMFGEPRGAHVHITVRGTGPEGARPLCGELVVTEAEAEWDSLIDHAAKFAWLRLNNPTLEGFV